MQSLLILLRNKQARTFKVQHSDANPIQLCQLSILIFLQLLFDLYSYFYHLLCMSRIYLNNNLNTELVKGHNFLLVLLNHTKPRLKLCKTIGFLNVQYSDTIQTPAVDYFTHCCNCRSTLIHLFVIITGPAFRYYCSLF